MSYRVSDQEFEAVSALASEPRYHHFIKRVADWQALWTIRCDADWVSISDNSGGTSLPVWPAERFARAYCNHEWASCTPDVITLEEWSNDVAPRLSESGVQIAVFPIDGRGIIVDAARLICDLEAEGGKYC